jgi:hypothetical protein
MPSARSPEKFYLLHRRKLKKAAEKGPRTEKIQILKHGRLVHLENWYKTLTGFKVNNGFHAANGKATAKN